MDGALYRRHSDGKRQRLTLGRYPALKLKDARERARGVINAAHEGADPAGAKKERRAADTFHGLAEQWLAAKTRQGRAASYLKRNEFRLKALPKRFTEMKARDVTRAHVAGALDEVGKDGATTEVNRYHAFISGVFKWAVSEGFLEADPSHGLKKRFDEAPRERVLTEAEVHALWIGIGGARASAGAKIAMRLCIALGQRPKEIAHTRRDALKLEGPTPTLTIPRTTTKNRIEHVVPLPRLAVDLIREALEISDRVAATRSESEKPEPSEWLFPAPGGRAPIDPHSFAVILHRARDKKTKTLFGMKDVQLYDARKTLATFLGDAGYPSEFVGLLLNHMTAKAGTVTGRHYNHARYLTQKREMIELWARHLERLLGIDRDEATNVVALPTRA